MVACLSCTADVLPRSSPFPSSRQRFGAQQALVFLQNCTNFKQLKQIHASIIRNGLSHDHVLYTKLLRLCSSHAKMDYANLVFEQIENPPTFAWNIMIRGLTNNGLAHHALLLYNLMICRRIPPDKFTFPFVIKACIACSAIDKGREVHMMAIKTGFLGDAFVQNTLMDLYFKCGGLGLGRKVFEKMRVRSVVSWTTIISGLISCGELDAARVIFERVPVKNIVSWTAMINGYARNQQPQVAFELFQRMQLENVWPNEFTLVSLLLACTDLGSLNLGRWIHDYALMNGFELGVFLGTALIDMYSKCGSLEDARQVFDKMQIKSLATWNSMITSLGVHGFGEEALKLFSEMEKANVQPDAVTFVGVLCACVHTGNLDEGMKYFKHMSEHYGIEPIPEHQTCMIELYNHANMLDEPYNNLAEAMVGASDVHDIANDNSYEELESLEGMSCNASKYKHQFFELDAD